MIRRAEIVDRVQRWGLREDVVEKDYVLGWVLWGIGSEPLLRETWVFKGGTCLKKCYIETYRFSEDRDFTVLENGPSSQTRQEGVRAGAQTHGDVQYRGGPPGGAGRDQAGSAELRRGQTPRAVRHRGTTAKTGPGAVSIPAQGQREHNIGHRLHDASVREGIVSDRPTLLLEHHLRELRLPTFLREYGKMAAQCAAEGVDHPDYLLRLSELELIDRHHRMVERRIRAARFPTVKSLDTFDFLAIPSVNRQLVTQLARCEYVDRRENIIAIGNSGTGKTHMALGLGLAACQRGLSVGFTTAAALVNELMEARDDRRLLNFQKRLSRLKLLIIDELGLCSPVEDRSGNCSSRSSASATRGVRCL